MNTIIAVVCVASVAAAIVYGAIAVCLYRYQRKVDALHAQCDALLRRHGL